MIHIGIHSNESLASSSIILEPKQRCFRSSILNSRKQESADDSIGSLAKWAVPFIWTYVIYF